MRLKKEEELKKAEEEKQRAKLEKVMIHDDFKLFIVVATKYFFFKF